MTLKIDEHFAGLHEVIVELFLIFLIKKTYKSGPLFRLKNKFKI